MNNLLSSLNTLSKTITTPKPTTTTDTTVVSTNNTVDDSDNSSEDIESRLLLEDIRNENGVLRKENFRLLKQLDLLKGISQEIDHLKEHSQHQQAIVKDLTRTLDDNEKIITKQRLELVTILPMKIKINELTNELHHAHNLNNSLRTENSILVISNQDLASQVDALKTEFQSLYDSKTQQDERLNMLEKQYNHIRSCNEAKKQEIQRLHEQNQELKSENKDLLDEKEELLAEYKHCDRLVTSLQREVAKLNRDHTLTLSELKEKIMKDDVTQALLSDSPPDTNAQIRQIKQQTTARMDEREDCSGVSCLFTGFRLLNLPKKSKHIL